MSQAVITELVLPVRPDERWMVDEIYRVHCDHERELVGSLDRMTPLQSYAHLFVQPNPHHPMRFAVALVPGDHHDQLVGYGWLQHDPGSDVGELEVMVAPPWQRQGIGRCLEQQLVTWHREAGRHGLIGWGESVLRADEPQLVPATGVGAVPADAPGTRFALAMGYSLEQVYRHSRLTTTPAVVDRARQLLAEATGGSADHYRVEVFVRTVPEALQDDLCRVLERMSTDAPQGDLPTSQQQWTRQRLQDSWRRDTERGVTRLTAGAIHRESGRLVGISDLLVQPDDRAPVGQQATLVLGEHRGHRLGMALKAANLVELGQRFGGRTIFTGNAEENRHMLATNEAVGFEYLLSESAWKKLV